MSDLRNFINLVESSTPLPEEDVALIKKAMEQQLARPNKAVVSPEMGFVSNRLNQEYQRPDLGKMVWSWACNSFDGKSLNNYPELVDLKNKLAKIDDESSRNFPDWGTRGT